MFTKIKSKIIIYFVKNFSLCESIFFKGVILKKKIININEKIQIKRKIYVIITLFSYLSN